MKTSSTGAGLRRVLLGLAGLLMAFAAYVNATIAVLHLRGDLLEIHVRPTLVSATLLGLHFGTFVSRRAPSAPNPRHPLFGGGASRRKAKEPRQIPRGWESGAGHSRRIPGTRLSAAAARGAARTARGGLPAPRAGSPAVRLSARLPRAGSRKQGRSSASPQPPPSFPYRYTLYQVYLNADGTCGGATPGAAA